MPSVQEEHRTLAQTTSDNQVVYSLHWSATRFNQSSKVVKHLCKESEAVLGLTGSMTARVGPVCLFVTTTAFTAVPQSLCLMQRGGTLAKCAGRAQDISANNIRQTACALASLVCQQVQLNLKVRQHLCKESEPDVGFTGSRN